MPTSSRKQRAVSLADVAKAAGTSTAVVSYVINDGPRPVATATRQRILDEIDRLGYRPNRIARALRSNRSNTLGLLIPDVSNAFFADLAHTFEIAAFRRGYVSFVGNASFNPKRERSYLRAFADLQVDGIAVVDLDNGESNADVFAEIQVPTVFIHHKTEGLPGDIVRFDEEAAGRLAAEVLAAQSVEHIVVVSGPTAPGPVSVRTTSFGLAMDASRRIGSLHTIETAFNRADAAQAFAEFLADNPGLSNVGVFTPTDEQALGVLHACAIFNRSVPEDIVVIGGEGTTAGRYSAPGLSSVDVPIDDMAMTALDLLKVRMTDDNASDTSTTLEVSFTERGTTRRSLA